MGVPEMKRHWIREEHGGTLPWKRGQKIEVAGTTGPSQTRRDCKLGTRKPPGKWHTKFRPGSYGKGTDMCLGDVPG